MAVEPLTPDTQRLIEQDFPLEHRSTAAGLLETKCGSNLPLMGEALAGSIERVRFAVLKLSHGSLDQLVRHVGIANIDWRDTLVAAGFGHGILAHRAWFREHMAD